MTDASPLRSVMLALLFLAALAGTFLALGRVAHADPPASPGVAAAAELAPGPAGAASPAPAPKPSDQLDDPLAAPGDAYADLVAAKRSGGWALALLAGLVMLTRTLARLPGAVGAWWRVGARATGLASAGAIGAAAFDALALGGTWIAVLFAAAGAGFALLAPVPPPKPTLTGPDGAARATLATLLVVVLAGAALQPACATARARGAAAAGAFIDCHAPAIQASVAELLPLATQAVLAAISGDGRHVDTDRLREAARPLRSDLGRCALAGAVAAIATPALTPRARAEQVMAAGLEVDGPALRAAFASVRAELGWPDVRGAGGAL